MRAHATDDDRGQAVVLVLAVVVIIIVMTVAMAAFAGHVHDIEQAQVAADAAALAAVDGGEAAARRLAAANQGVVVEFRAVGDDVLVTVEVDGRRASARARRAP